MRLLKVAVLVAALTMSVAYTVQPGDTLWDISVRAHADLRQLIRENGIKDPNLIHPGQLINIPASDASRNPLPGRAEARTMVTSAAQARGVETSLVLAVADWESGFNQAAVSGDGAIGIMQITPATANWAGPRLLGRRVDLRNPSDNTLLGAALIRMYLEQFHDPRLALAAYYQGPTAVKKYGIYPSSLTYVDGIMTLRGRFQAGTV